VNPAKTEQPIEVLSGACTGVVSVNHLLDGRPDLSTGSDTFGVIYLSMPRPTAVAGIMHMFNVIRKTAAVAAMRALVTSTLATY